MQGKVNHVTTVAHHAAALYNLHVPFALLMISRPLHVHVCALSYM